MEEFILATILTTFIISLFGIICSYLLVRSLQRTFREYLIALYEIQHMQKLPVRKSEYRLASDSNTKIVLPGLSQQIRGTNSQRMRAYKDSHRFLLTSTL